MAYCAIDGAIIMRLPRGLVLGAIGLLAVELAGCAALRGQPPSLGTEVQSMATSTDTYGRGKVIANFYATDASARDNQTPRTYRNRVAEIYLLAAETNYQQFKGKLSKEMKGPRFGLDLGVLLLNGVAAVSGEEAANALAAGSSTLVGAGTALDADVFRKQTIEAVIATMDATRATQVAEIKRRLVEEDEVRFSLGDALQMIEKLNGSASVNAAAGEIAADAGKKKEQAEAEAEVVAQTTVPLLPQDIANIRANFTRYVRGLDDAGVLAQLRDALSATNDADPAKLKNNIRRAYLAKAVDRASVDGLAATLKPITGQDFK